MKTTAFILSLLACVAGGPSALAAVSCVGAVYSNTIGPDGDYFVDFGYGRTRICATGGTVTVYRAPGNTSPVNITPAVCTALQSFFMTAEAAGQDVTASVDRSDCNMGDGVYPNPYPTSFKITP